MSTTIAEFANELYENSRSHGFYELEDRLRSNNNTIPQANLDALLAEHYGNRLMLIVGEAVEAHEELRAGRGVAELYFRRPDTGQPTEDSHGYVTSNAPVAPNEYPEMADVLFKPEGVLAELADVAIRSLETIAGILAQLTPEEAERLRGQVPQSEYTTVTADALHNRSRTAAADPVNVAEILNLKHEFNLSRAPKHGGKAF